MQGQSEGVLPGGGARVGRALRFLLPSAAGVLVFLTPLPWQGALTIGIGIATDAVRALMGTRGLHVVAAVIAATALLTVAGTVLRAPWILRRPFLARLFDVPAGWMVLRLAGLGFVACYLFQVGPALLRAESVGGAVFEGIGTNMLSVYVAACFLLPLLTDYGLMEFTGTLAAPLFRRAFRLPGHAAIDATASVVGASAIGLLITIEQYEAGRYTAREASVIATSFSIVSIPFSLVVASVAGIERLFLPWYGTVLLACLVAALVMPRLPPLSRKDERRFVVDAGAAAEGGAGDAVAAAAPLLARAWRRALARAATAPGPRAFLAAGLRNLAFFAFAVVGASLALATLAALLVFHTPVFAWLGTPFVPLLAALGMPEPVLTAGALFTGFLDQFMPALAAGDSTSDVTRFVLAGLSVCQLVFMSEVGVIILRSSLPLTLRDLGLIFLLRTALVLPVLVLGARVLLVPAA